MKYHAKLLILLIASTYMITGCSFSKKNEQIIQRTDLSDITESNYTMEDYDNLIMPDNIELNSVDKLYTFSIISDSNNDPDENSDINKYAKEKMLALVKNYSGTEIFDDDIEFNAYEYNDGTLISVELSYLDPTNNMMYSYNPNGTFSIQNLNEIEKDVHSGECLSYAFISEEAEIVLDNEIKEFPVSEAIDICKDKVVNKIIDIIPEDSLNPYSISVFRNSDASYSYYIVYAKEYLGLNLSEASEYINLDTGFIKPTYICVQINDEKEIYSVMNVYSSLYDETSIQEIENDSYITLESACSLLSNYLAGNKKYNIEKISMTYFLPTRMDTNYSSLAYTRYIPGYEIILESRMPFSANLTPRKTAYIDMLTGEIYISDSIDMQPFFEMN